MHPQDPRYTVQLICLLLFLMVVASCWVATNTHIVLQSTI